MIIIIIIDDFSWRVGSGSSSFWFCNWSSHGFIGSLAPFIDIHDLYITVKNAFSSGNLPTHPLCTHLPSFASDFTNKMHLKFNSSLEHAFI